MPAVCVSALDSPSSNLHGCSGVQKNEALLAGVYQNNPLVCAICQKSQTSSQPLTPLVLFKQHCSTIVKSSAETEASISPNNFHPLLITHFTICSLFFTVMWAGESFRQHSVGGCPFVGMHSICVGCLLGRALLWMGHWEARAPWLQSDRYRLVGAPLETACRQTLNQHPQYISAWFERSRGDGAKNDI